MSRPSTDAGNRGRPQIARQQAMDQGSTPNRQAADIHNNSRSFGQSQGQDRNDQFLSYQNNSQDPRQNQSQSQQNQSFNQSSRPKDNFDRGYNQRDHRSGNGQTQDYGSDNQRRLKSPVWVKCAEYIKQQMPGMIELYEFMKQYDIFDGRVFEKWELQEIFPFLSEQNLNDIGMEFKDNSRQQVNWDQVCDYWFLSDRIEETRLIQVLTKRLPKEGEIYETQQINPNVKEMLLQIMKQTHSLRNFKTAFESLFGFQDSRGREIYNVSQIDLQEVFEKKLRVRHDPRDYGALQDYFNPMDKKSTNFSKIMFVRGMTSFQKNYDEQGNPLKPQTYNQNQYQDQRNQGPPRNNRDDEEWYDDDAVRRYDQYERGRDSDRRNQRDNYQRPRSNRRDPQRPDRRLRDTRNRDESREDGRTRSYSREFDDDKKEKRRDDKPDLKNKFPDDIEVLIERISKFLDTKKTKSLSDCLKLQTEYVARTNAVKRAEFILCIQNFQQEGLKMEEREAEKLANHFKFRKNDIDYVNFNDVQNAVFDQVEVFETLVTTYANQLTALRQAIRKRRAAAFSWFKTHARTFNGKAITEEEFSKAISALDLIEITQDQRHKIFKLLDADGNAEVPIYTIENALKFFDRNNKKSRVAPINDIIEKVLKAFNCDEDQLKQRLLALQKQNTLELTDFVNYMVMLPGSTDYYTSDEIDSLGENFMDEEKGTIDLPEMLSNFLDVRLTRNLVRDTYKKGIHEQLPLNWNPQTTPQVNNPVLNQPFQAMPRAATQAALFGKVKPMQFRKTGDEFTVDMITRALYCTNMTAQQFFTQYADYSRKLSSSHFQTAIGALGIMIQSFQLQNLFNQIVKASDTQSMSAITPDQIDDFLHFSCDKNFQQLHNELLLDLNQAMRRFQVVSFAQVINSNNPNMNMQSIHPDIIVRQIKQSLKTTMQSDTDFKFLMLQYLHPTMPSMIMVQNLVQDVDSISLRTGMVQPNQLYQQQPMQFGSTSSPTHPQNSSQPNNQPFYDSSKNQQPGFGPNQSADQQRKERLITQIVQNAKQYGLKDIERPFTLLMKSGARTLSSLNFKDALQKVDKMLTFQDIDFLSNFYREKDTYKQYNDDVEILVFFDDIRNEREKGPSALKNSQNIKSRISQPSRDDHNFIKMIKQMDVKLNGSISDQIEQVFQAYFDNYKRTKINKQDTYQCLQRSNVQLSQMEAREFDSWWLQHAKLEGQDQFVEIEDLFRPLGLENARLIREAHKKDHKNRSRILSDEMLRDCHLLCVQIKNDIVRQNVTVDRLLQSFGFMTEKTIDYKTFHSKLKQAVTLPETRSKIQDSKIMTNLIYYLAREEKHRVSIQKLRFALEMKETDQPLRQECIEEEKKIYQRTFSSLMDGQVPAPVRHLLYWLEQQGKEIPAFFNVAGLPDIKRSVFELTLKQAGYTNEHMEEISKKLSVGAQNISLKKLQDYKDLASGIQKSVVGGKVTDKNQAKDRAAVFEPSVKMNLKKVTNHLLSIRMTSDDLFKQWDRDGDGTVSKTEFVYGISMLKQITISAKEAGLMFEALDTDASGELTRNEFNMYIEGTQMTLEERRKNLSPILVADVKRQIFEAFSRFDENNDQSLEPQELRNAMKGVGRTITLNDAKKIIADATQNRKNTMNYQEFENFFLPMIIDKILSIDDKTSEMRKIFLQADTDYSGFLSADELYGVLLKLKVEVSFHDLVSLLSDNDVDGDAKLNIDEFIQLMLGDDFGGSQHQETLNKIKQGSNGSFDFAEILKELSVMPDHFVKSFYDIAKIRPSDCIRVQIDPKTYLYKDMMWNQSTSQTQATSYLQPYESLLGCEITLETADGVPLPKETKDQNVQIVRRAVRVGIFDKAKRKLTFNTAMVKAEWNEKEPGQWTFTHSQNPVLFRSIAEDGLDLKGSIDNYDFIFELVVFMKNKDKEDKITQYCCGWADAPLSCAKKNFTHKVDLKGGSPLESSDIDSKDVVQEKGFLKSVLGLNQTSKSRISIKFASKEKWTKEAKAMVDLLPSTCFINKNLLSFIVSYREYAASVLKVAGSDVPYSKPSGDVVLRCFPEIIDNPDIAEILTAVWVEDHVANNKEKDPIKALVNYKEAMAKVTKKLWPVLFSDELNEQNPLRPKGVQAQDNLQRLIQSALRYQTGNKNKNLAPPEQLTYFKPFNIRELEIDVWDGHERIYDPSI